MFERSSLFLRHHFGALQLHWNSLRRWSEVENPTGRKCCTPPRSGGWISEMERWKVLLGRNQSSEVKSSYFFVTVQRLKILNWQSWFIIFSMFLLQPWTCWDSSLFFGGWGLASCCGKKPSPGYPCSEGVQVKTVQHHKKKHNPQMLNVLGCPRKLVNG